MILTWFVPPQRSYEWIGQTGETLALIRAGQVSVIASVIGPRGAPGPTGADSTVPGPVGIVGKVKAWSGSAWVSVKSWDGAAWRYIKAWTGSVWV